MPTQPLGWFKKPITKADDFKGLKFRTVGISIDVFTGMGAAVNALPGGEIVPAMDRGLLDAAEFNNASSDRILGFPDVSKVCMLQSYHQNAEQFEIMFNKTKYDALPAKMKAIIENAVEAASADMSWKAIDRYSKDYVEMQAKDKVRFYKTPDSVLQRQLEVYDEAAAKKSAEQPAVQGDRRVPADVRRARGEVGPRHQRQPSHGLQPLLRQEALSPRRRRQEGASVRDRQPSRPRQSDLLSTGLAVLRPMKAERFIRSVDQFSYWSGKTFAWLIVALTFVVSIEVFKRYILNAPTAWIFDFNNMLYGTLFMMCGAYTLAQGGHVRADFVYLYLKPRAQAALDLALYLCSSSRASSALIYAGYGYAADPGASASTRPSTAEGPPVYHFKSVIPIAGALVMLQGLAEIVRCIVCIRTGAWPPGLRTSRRSTSSTRSSAHSEYVDEESRRAAMEGANAIDDAARHRSVGAGVVHERPSSRTRRSRERSLLGW